jgi:hypothetical protein
LDLLPLLLSLLLVLLVLAPGKDGQKPLSITALCVFTHARDIAAVRAQTHHSLSIFSHFLVRLALSLSCFSGILTTLAVEDRLVVVVTGTAFVLLLALRRREDPAFDPRGEGPRSGSPLTIQP